MIVDFNNIPEYEIFEDLTTMNGMFGRGVIDPSKQPKHFKVEDRKLVFKELLIYFKDNGFKELYEEYLNILKHKSFRDMNSIHAYNNFTFNHPLVVMLWMFIEQGLLTRELEVGANVKLVELGEKVLTAEELRNKNISEGVVFADGTLMPIKSNEAHKIAALWMLLNGRSLHKAVRYTSDCINPEPIYSSMSEYAKLESNTIIITKQQAIALYNIFKATSSSSVKKQTFAEVLENSADLCITVDGNAEIRYANAKTFEYVLGEDVFDAKEVIKELRAKSFLF